MGIFNLFKPKPDVFRMRAERDIEGLIETLKHKSLSVRGDAAYHLGEIGDTKAIEPLLQVLKDNDCPAFVRWEAAKALRQIARDTKEMESLIKAIDDAIRDAK